MDSYLLPLLAYNQTQRRILSIFRFLHLPQYWTFEWWSQTNVVYMRLHWIGEFYIGSTETTVFLREQSRTRKYKQHVAQQLAFFEPAIKLWCKRDNFYQFCIFPLRSQCGDAEHRLSLEQALQQTLRPIYNWPWINPLLKRWRIGKSRFGFTSVNPTVAFGRRLVRRYKKRTRAQYCSLFEQQFDNHLRIFRLLYMLGSDTLMKFECSKLLRSSQADHDYIFLLCRLSRNLTEPFRSRAQQQLKLILQFRNSEFPPANVPVQLLILDDEMESQMRSWLKGFIVHHQVNFPPFHKPKVPFVSTKGRTLGSYLFNFRLHLRWWHPTDRPTCRCHLLPKTSISETPHVSIFAADISGICSVYTAHMEDQISPSWNKFVVLPHFGANVCVYTVITNGFSSFHCSCTILKSRGQRYPCHFLCQRSWVTCGKDIDQGRLIYVPAIVSTVDFLFLFMSCALFLRSRIWVRWNSTARQLRKSGEDYDIIHTFYLPLPHSVSWVFDLTWSHRRLVSTNQKVMSGHFPVFRVEYESPKPYALRVHFKRHMTESRFYTVKSNRSSHKAK